MIKRKFGLLRNSPLISCTWELFLTKANSASTSEVEALRTSLKEYWESDFTNQLIAALHLQDHCVLFYSLFNRRLHHHHHLHELEARQHRPEISDIRPGQIFRRR
jgi:hypothetical protein